MNTNQSSFSIFCVASPEIMRPQERHFWGGDLFQAVFAILYQVLHCFYRVFWVMRQGRKIYGLIGDPIEALHGFQRN